MGERTDGNIAEAYELDGVQAQIGHATLQAWENDIAEVLERWNADTPLHKAMSGTLDCVAVHGDEHITRWKAKIRNYPDGLARAMVERWLKIFPVWYVQDALDERDATLWHFQIRTETAYNLLGILAGLNRQYFTTFQFKKMRRFLDQMPVKPERLADRLEEVFRQCPSAAAVSLETLMREVLALVGREMPQVDVSALTRRIGSRRPRWDYVASRR